jgi:hypothetical protein
MRVKLFVFIIRKVTIFKQRWWRVDSIAIKVVAAVVIECVQVAVGSLGIDLDHSLRRGFHVLGCQEL